MTKTSNPTSVTAGGQERAKDSVAAPTGGQEQSEDPVAAPIGPTEDGVTEGFDKAVSENGDEGGDEMQHPQQPPPPLPYDERSVASTVTMDPDLAPLSSVYATTAPRAITTPRTITTTTTRHRRRRDSGQGEVGGDGEGKGGQPNRRGHRHSARRSRQQQSPDGGGGVVEAEAVANEEEAPLAPPEQQTPRRGSQPTATAAEVFAAKVPPPPILSVPSDGEGGEGPGQDTGEGEGEREASRSSAAKGGDAAKDKGIGPRDESIASLTSPSLVGYGRQRSITSSTRSVMSNYSGTDPADAIREEDLEGLLVVSPRSDGGGGEGISPPPPPPKRASPAAPSNWSVMTLRGDDMTVNTMTSVEEEDEETGGEEGDEEEEETVTSTGYVSSVSASASASRRSSIGGNEGGVRSASSAAAVGPGTSGAKAVVAGAAPSRVRLPPPARSSAAPSHPWPHRKARRHFGDGYGGGGGGGGGGEAGQQQPLEGGSGFGGGKPNVDEPATGPSAHAPPSAAPVGGGDEVLRAIAGLRDHVDRRVGEMHESSQRDLDRVFTVIQQESAKRTALEGRLHQQLLLQSETMVAMELKLLRLEAKVERREAVNRQRRQLPVGSGGSGGMAAGGAAAGGSASQLPPIAAMSPSPNTIDEEDDFESLESLEHRRPSRTWSGGPHALHSAWRPGGPAGPTNIAVVRSGASVASAVTATSFLDGDSTLVHDDGSTKEGHTVEDDGNDDVTSKISDDDDEGDAEDGGNDESGSASTPTQSSSRNQFATLDSILMNPMLGSATSEHGTSTRATRGDMDEDSTLATSVTSATLSSTIVTATTRGGDSTANARSTLRSSEDEINEEDEDDDDDNDDDTGSGIVDVIGSTANPSRGRQQNIVTLIGVTSPAPVDRPRSRSHSPLTVQSAATASVGPQSIASASVGTGASILSTAAVAPARSFASRRAAAAAAAAMSSGAEGRPLANRVVSFTSNQIVAPPPREMSEAGDSITMPDELDNLSDVADAFASSSRLWREEYEARLDAIQKRWAAE